MHQSPVNSPHKGQCRGALMLSLTCAWINGWANNRKAGDLRRHHAHYDDSAKKLAGHLNCVHIQTLLFWKKSYLKITSCKVLLLNIFLNTPAVTQPRYRLLDTLLSTIKIGDIAVVWRLSRTVRWARPVCKCRTTNGCQALPIFTEMWKWSI